MQFTPVLSPVMNVMIKAVFKAARSLKRDFGEVGHLQVSVKGPGDFATAADLRAEKILSEELLKARPTYGFLGEESAEIIGSEPDCRWIVDPLDGTSNFMHGLPHFAISVALEKNGDMVAGVIYDPVKNELFRAEKGGGAFLNDQRLRVSSRKKLDDSLLATGIPFQQAAKQPEFLQQLHMVMPKVAGVRRWGAAALDMAYVAAGRYEGYWENTVSLWDIAAGIVIVREAGGKVTDIEGQNNFTNRSVVATNGHLHTSVLHLIQKPGK